MNANEILQAHDLHTTDILDAKVTQACSRQLATNGWVLLRGFEVNLDRFSQLVSKFCSKLTFDPAREYSNQSTQKVDAGIREIGLHIENGNTPFPPDLIGFYSKRSAKHGSQTTICDGVTVYENLSEPLKEKLCQPITVSRNLPENLWKRYAANEHPGVNCVDEVDASHLEQILSIVPNHRGTLNQDGSLHYELDINAVIKSTFNSKKAFANAILGPSFNYEAPHYSFADGSQITDELKHSISELAEQYTKEIPWCDGDIALIDNKRVMHGRRAIIDHENRELFIGMGLV